MPTPTKEDNDSLINKLRLPADMTPAIWLTATSKLPKAMGTYVLVMQLAEDKTIAIGKLGVFNLRAGRYYYVGSAMGAGGLASRVGRHFRADADKNMHWHVDYLRAEMTLVGCWVWQSEMKLECDIAQQLSTAIKNTSQCSVMAKVGSSDCGCLGHVFYLSDSNEHLA